MTTDTTDMTKTPAEAYEDYFGPAIFDPLAAVVLEHEPPRPGERVLDLACGTGIVARRAARLVGDTGHVVGLDINPGMIEVAVTQAEAAGTDIEFHQGDAVAMDLPDGAFDLVLCQQGLQFFPDRAAGVAQMRRVLTADGRAVVATWQRLDRHPLYAALADAEVPHRHAFGVPVDREEAVAPFSLGDPDELAALFRDAGFRDVEVVARSIEARFAAADRFVERMEYAYAAVVPEFMDDPDAFRDYLERINQDTKAIVAEYRVGDEIVVPMHTRVAVARV